jgi:hypothetical protein
MATPATQDATITITIKAVFFVLEEPDWATGVPVDVMVGSTDSVRVTVGFNAADTVLGTGVALVGSPVGVLDVVDG